MTCQHKNIIGDNYGETCADCGEQISGYGYGGLFGQRLSGTEKCKHVWTEAGEFDDIHFAFVCIYCQAVRENESE